MFNQNKELHLYIQKRQGMKTVANTKKNNAIVKALKNIPQSEWNGTTVHPSIEMCLTAMNLQTFNSGQYNPNAVKLRGIEGIFMLNQDGSINYEMRIKEEEGKYKIEYLSLKGFCEAEKYLD